MSFYEQKRDGNLTVGQASVSDCDQLFARGNSYEKGCLVSSCVFFVRHAKDLDALNDAEDLIDNAYNSKGYEVKDDSENACLNLALHKARNADRVEDDRHNTVKNFVVHFERLQI